MIRPIASEAKLAHVEQVPWDLPSDQGGLKNEFKRQVTTFVNAVGKRITSGKGAKVVAGKHLNAGMLLQLAMEYTEAINAKETPTVMTALERVIQAETVHVGDKLADEFRRSLEEHLNEDQMPITSKEFRKIIKGERKKVISLF